MNKIFKDFFVFSKKELNGLFVFFILLLLVVFAPHVYSYFHPSEVYDYSEFKKEVAIFRASAIKNEPYTNRYSQTDNYTASAITTDKLFNFNPNNLAVSDWQKLGLSEKQIKVIKNFESKGGKFYRKEDLKKIYSIKADDYAKLEPFIIIPENANAYKINFRSAEIKKDIQPLKLIDINTADSVQFESLNGIGPAFASRIIKYRSRLGGFYQKEQLKEVYGLDSIVYQKVISQLTLDPTAINQIPINTVMFDDLKTHPYLSYKQVNAIIQYRKQHGNFKSINDMKAILILNENVLRKIEPYLSFGSK